MSYYELDHADHVRDNYGKEPSELGKRVAVIIGCVFGGLYNTIGADKVDYANERFMELVTPAGGEMATFDFNRLTEIVFMAHDLSVRVSFMPFSRDKYKIMFHLRKRDGGMSSRHPTIEESLERHRKDWPASRCVTTEKDLAQ